MFNERSGVAAIVMLALAVSLAPFDLQADNRHGHSFRAHQAQDRKGSNSRISSERAAEIARSATGGQVLSVRLDGNSYRVKVLLNGERVRTIKIDARSGAMRD